jgi:2-polyprenyl-6-methoxyphenol hydroxylase-like FAD-dependent oxidoreductase
VVATVHTDDRSEERIRARYLIGCDGSHSTVRRLDATFIRSRITNFTAPRGFLSILPFLGDYVRVFAVDFAQQHRDRGDDLSLDELQNAVDAIAPQRIPLSEPTWLTRYIAPSRQVSTTRVGRVFLAGDAAQHTAPPAGKA